jgi:hypothetical protein
MAKEDMDVRFNKFGTVSFTALTKTNDFIDYLEQGKIMGTRCTQCGATFFPPRADCYVCLSSDMDWFEVSGKGKLVSYTRLEYGPVGFENDLPYALALVDYGNYKVFGRLNRDIPDDALKIGMDVKAEVVTMPNGQLLYQFVKA